MMIEHLVGFAMGVVLGVFNTRILFFHETMGTAERIYYVVVAYSAFLLWLFRDHL